MNITEKEIIVYGLVKPYSALEEKVQRLYENLNMKNMCTIEGFYILYANDIEKLNISKIKTLEQLTLRVKSYEKYRKKLMRQGKLASCYNCAFRIGKSKQCYLNATYNEVLEQEYYDSMPSNHKCKNFLRRMKW